MNPDLHELSRFDDRQSYLYVEHCRIDRDAKAIAMHDKDGITHAPAAALALVMLGPGTRITHAAVQALADNNCLIAWVGEQGIRHYAHGVGGTRSSANLLRQAALWADAKTRLAVVERMYRHRFEGDLPSGLNLKQIRGREGVRVRQAYADAAEKTGVEWTGRAYTRGDWGAADPVNRALSSANACLYGVVHAAIVSAGYSPAIGFIHTGKMLSFVYDIADLYKAELTIPLAFEVVGTYLTDLERSVRRECRDRFRQADLMARIIPDMAAVLDVPGAPSVPTQVDAAGLSEIYHTDAVRPGGLWDPESGTAEGGMNYGGPDRREGPGELAGDAEPVDD